MRLKEEDPKLQDRIMFFDLFEILNKAKTDEMTQKSKQYVELISQIPTLIPDVSILTQTVRTRPDYAREAKGFSYIYLTDASGHGTQSITQEVAHVLRSVRQANPQARILLAFEFAYMTDFATPMHFARQSNDKMDLYPVTNSLVPLADQLNIDVLALDDNILMKDSDEDGDPYLVYKIGNILLAKQVDPETVTDSTVFERAYEELYLWANATTLGIYLRNEQWISYIKAVKPYYDIVIVYAGGGHIESSTLPTLDVPNQIGKDAVTFNLYTAEQNQKEDEFALQGYQTLCNENACVRVSELPSQEPRANAIEWDGTSYVYQKIDSQDTQKYIKTLEKETQEKIDTLFKQAAKLGLDDKMRYVSFDVYIPDVTQ